MQVTSILLDFCYSNHHQRIAQRCLLGERVVYEKRISEHKYDRPINTTSYACKSSIEDFEWYKTVLVKFCGSFSLQYTVWQLCQELVSLVVWSSNCTTK